MIKLTEGDLLEASAEALVNTVNTVGVMGKGIALMFKERFPENYKAYEAACEVGAVRVGEMFVTAGVELGGPRWIINFPTKKHWRQPSKSEWIRDGLVALKGVGCGNGGLDWAFVHPLIEAALKDLPNVEILLFVPTATHHLNQTGEAG